MIHIQKQAFKCLKASDFETVNISHKKGGAAILGVKPKQFLRKKSDNLVKKVNQYDNNIMPVPGNNAKSTPNIRNKITKIRETLSKL